MRRIDKVAVVAVAVGGLMLGLAPHAQASPVTTGTPAGAEAAVHVPDAVRAELKSALAKLDSGATARTPAALPGIDSTPARDGSIGINARDVCYAAHVQDIGWQSPVCNGSVAGTTGQGLRLEAFSVMASAEVGSVCYKAYVQNIGWQGAVCDGEVAGTTGQSLRIEAIGIILPNEIGNVCYVAHVQNIGWQNALCNGEFTPRHEGLRVEAMRITV